MTHNNFTHCPLSEISTFNTPRLPNFMQIKTVKLIIVVSQPTISMKFPLTDVIDGARAELAEEFLRPERLQVVNEVRPEVKDVVSREAISFLDDHRLASEECHLDGDPQSARPGSNYQHLQKMYNKYSMPQTRDGAFRRPVKCSVTLFSWIFNTLPPPCTANNVAPYTFINTFFWER